MQCKNHPQEEAAGVCVYCGKLYCQNCLVEIDSRYYCREHVKEAVKIIKTGIAVETAKDKSSEGGIVINNNLTSDSSSKVKVKKTGIVNGCGGHLLFQLLCIIASSGLAIISLLFILQGEGGAAIFFFVLTFITLLLFRVDYSHCKRFHY